MSVQGNVTPGEQADVQAFRTGGEGGSEAGIRESGAEYDLYSDRFG